MNPAQYDAVADEYAHDNFRSVCNAHYERPAMLMALGDVSGMTIAELGCGPGFLLEILQSRGAQVIGLDSSLRLLAIARRRLPTAKLINADLNGIVPLVPTSQFDVIVGSLFLHYIADPHRLLTQCFEMLKAEGQVVMSTHHPCAGVSRFSLENYHCSQLVTDRWRIGDVTFDVQFFHRSLSEIVVAFTRSGFQIQSIWEPQPDGESWNIDPDRARELATTPRHLFLAAKKPA